MNADGFIASEITPEKLFDRIRYFCNTDGVVEVINPHGTHIRRLTADKVEVRVYAPIGKINSFLLNIFILGYNMIQVPDNPKIQTAFAILHPANDRQELNEVAANRKSGGR